MQRYVLVLLLSIPAFAQTDPTFGRFTFGVTGGVPIQGKFGSLDAKRYTLGPSIEYRLTDHISINFNPLYKRLGNDSSTPLNSLPSILANIDKTLYPTISWTSSSRTRANTWEFPIMAKYYFGSPTRNVRPFLGTGYAFEKSWVTTDSNGVIITTATGAQTPTKSSISYSPQSKTGAMLGAGVLIQKNKIGITPEFRYTYWGQGGGTRDQNQVDFLLNIRF